MNTSRQILVSALGTVLLGLFVSGDAAAQGPPTRPSDAPGAPKWTVIPGAGKNAPAKGDGDFLIGPEYLPAPELTEKPGVPKGTVQQFVMESRDSKIYPIAIAREGGLGIIDALERGAIGSMPAANFTSVFARIHAAWDSGNRELASDLLAGTLPYSVWAMQSLDHSVTAAKRELMRRGIFACDRLRQPAVPLDEIARAQLDRWIDRVLTQSAD